MHFENQKVVDKDGAWFRNLGAFPFTDPTNGVRFEPGWGVKVKVTDWMKSQPVIEKVVDDTAPEPTPEPTPEVATPVVAAKPAKSAKEVPVAAPAAETPAAATPAV